MADTLFFFVLGVVVVERLAEMLISSRHVHALSVRGGRVLRGDGYDLLVIVHVGAILGLVAEFTQAPWAGAWVGTWPLLGLGLLAFALRYWVMSTLGPRWTTRVVVLSGARPVTGGPYRWIRHPNYVAVMVELAVIPLAFGCFATAIAASVVNAAALAVRIRIEERALRDAGGYDEAFAGRGRFVP